MTKRFNITGVCRPDRHYLADVSGKISSIMHMVEEGEYFVINRPRQYGKTTTLRYLVDKMKAEDHFLPIQISFERLGTKVFASESLLAERFTTLICNATLDIDIGLQGKLARLNDTFETLDELHKWISDFVLTVGKKVVLLIDEVDKSTNNQMFLHLLGIFRDKYLEIGQGKPTFHSVILAGVYDVKNLKLRLRTDEEQKYNSPWNIATDFKVEMSLLPHEIEPMLAEYAKDKNVRIDVQSIAETVFYYTSGYPFLVSKLCKMFDEELLITKKERIWTKADVEWSVKEVIKESNVNFDSLLKNLENNPDLYELVYQVIIEGNLYGFTIQNPQIELGLTYGIFKNSKNEYLQIHNRLYRELIANYMISKMETSGKPTSTQIAQPFLLADNALNMEKVLLRFQVFMREQFSPKDRGFLEKQGRLVFLAFFRPILNGKGYTFNEAQISEEKRVDVLVTFYQHKYIVELKLWHGAAAHKEGIAQLADYLDRQGLDKGYLVIFDHRKKTKTWKNEWIFFKEKQIFAIWV